MSETIRVLIVEDSEDDVQLLLRSLRRGPWQVVHQKVDTPDAMSAALDQETWDLIIADYSMPQFSGPAALALASARACDLPFILISGVMGEEIAVKAMKAGADDYLSKGSLTRLVPVVERELHKADEVRESRRIEKKLRRQEAHLAEALELARVGTWHLDVTTQTAVWSKEAARLVGLQGEQEMAGLKKLFSHLHAKDVVTLKDLLRDPATRQFTKDLRLIRDDGTTQYLRIQGDIVRDGQLTPLEVAGTVQEITESKRVEKALAESQERLLGIIATAMDAIITVDENLIVTLFNAAAEKMFGCPAEEAIGNPLVRFIPERFRKNMAGRIQHFGETDVVARALDTGQQLYGRRCDGSEFPIEATVSHITVGGRKLYTAMVRDIGERKRVESELAAAMKNAQAASQSKSEFLANMSHEIRTPMTAILGFTEMLMNKSQEDCEEIGCIQIIRRNALHLLELINEILDLSKIEASQMKVERIAFKLPELLYEVIALMRPRALEKGIAFAVMFEGPIPEIIETDAMRLRQILVNLIGNAIKFTNVGKISVRVSDNGQSSERIALCIDVTDSGIGMTTEQIARLFQPFTQGDESITRKFGGTGLGLTISRRLARLLNGDITVASAIGTGSTFTLSIDGGPSHGVRMLHDLTDAKLRMQAISEVHHEIALRGRILLVEDGRDNQRLLRTLLTDAGAIVAIAENGYIGVKLATTQPFDLILMDMQMPVMDGYAATAELRRLGIKTPIIALTAFAMAEDRSRCVAIGCTAYLSKPVNEDTLLKTVNQHLPNGSLPAMQTAGNTTPTAESPPPSEATPSVRIVSSLADNPRMQKIIPEFVDGLAGEVSKMVDLIQRNDLAALRPIVHQLLGACGGYGFEAVSEPAGKAEQLIRAGSTLEAITTEINSLISVIRRIDGYDESKEVGAKQQAT